MEGTFERYKIHLAEVEEMTFLLCLRIFTDWVRDITDMYLL